jgi:hypothetical protein
MRYTSSGDPYVRILCLRHHSTDYDWLNVILCYAQFGAEIQPSGWFKLDSASFILHRWVVSFKAELQRLYPSFRNDGGREGLRIAAFLIDQEHIITSGRRQRFKSHCSMAFHSSTSQFMIFTQFRNNIFWYRGLASGPFSCQFSLSTFTRCTSLLPGEKSIATRSWSSWPDKRNTAGAKVHCVMWDLKFSTQQTHISVALASTFKMEATRSYKACMKSHTTIRVSNTHTYIYRVIHDESDKLHGIGWLRVKNFYQHGFSSE